MMKLQNQLRAISEMNEQLQLENSVLKQQFQEYKAQLVDTQSSLAKAESINAKFKKKLNKAMEEVRQKEEARLQLKTYCSSIKGSNYYAKNKRKEKELERREKDLNKQNGTDSRTPAAFLKSRKKSLQTMLSNQRRVSKDLRLALRQLQKENREMQDQIDALEADILAREDCVMETRGPKNQFLDKIPKCVIQLQGENGVAAKNCGPVIQTVAKWVFGNEMSQQDVPSASLAVNMADEGHVLAKYYIAESILTTERWNLHADGTMRDYKKIVGQQVTLGDGRALSAGFFAGCCNQFIDRFS